MGIRLPFTVAVCLHREVRAIGSWSVAAPRLLILADPKMLPALANGLREGGRFDVLPVPLSDGGAAAAAAPQRDAVAQRDECFRAGASDLLFMPMSKEQFVGRLEGAVALAYSPDEGPA